MAFTQDLDLYRFIQIPATAEVPYSFCIGKYPVTNAQYERFLNAPDFGDETLWHGFLKFNENCVQMGRWESEGWDWFRERSKDIKQIVPNRWNDENFGVSNPENPVVGISWYEANAYCNWLLRHWNEMAESKANMDLHPLLIRLPLETEWVTAAGGNTPQNRFPWDVTGEEGTTDTKEIVKRANVKEGGVGHTTPVNAYLCGASPHGVMDMGAMFGNGRRIIATGGKVRWVCAAARGMNLEAARVSRSATTSTRNSGSTTSVFGRLCSSLAKHPFRDNG